MLKNPPFGGFAVAAAAVWFEVADVLEEVVTVWAGATFFVCGAFVISGFGFIGVAVAVVAA